MAHQRRFSTGAVRDSDNGKPNLPDYLDSLVLWRYGKYMKLAELKYGRGNFKKGIPIHEYLCSLSRHILKLEAEIEHGIILEDSDHAAGILFNIVGLMYEQQRTRSSRFIIKK